MKNFFYYYIYFFLFHFIQIILNSNHHYQKKFPDLSEVNDLACTNFIIVSVNGLVCDFCAQSLQKTFGKMKGSKECFCRPK